MEEKISLGGNIWKYKKSDERLVELMVQRFDIPEIVAKLLNTRDIKADEVENFLDPKLQNLMPDPNVLKDMDKAAARLAEAVKNQEKVGIIGDYDVDGATSSALLGLFLEHFGLKTHTHIPERDEGYGPSEKAFAEFDAEGIKLVVTTDCGTAAFDILSEKSKNGFEIIILDHHEAEVRLPEVHAVVNPKRLDETDDYPTLKYMSAVGVVFMTLVAINRDLRESGYYKDHQAPDLFKWLDLVALGTVCDVVPLMGINRAFVRQGLRVMAKRTNIGLKMLIDKSGITSYPNSYNLGFALGPRINACGRVGEAWLGNMLLKAKTEEDAGKLVDKMNEFNTERKEIENYVLLQATEMLEKEPQEYPMAFVFGNDWHQGVIGIVAGKLKEKYNVPAFVMSIEDDEVKGSARSVSGIDLGAMIIAAKEKGLITKGGGHIMAAGFSLNEDKIADFKNFVGEEVAKQMKNCELSPVLEIDAALDAGGANPLLAEKIEMMEPFGASNEEPILVLKNVMINAPAIIGSGHIRCSLKSDNGKSIKAIAFRVADTQIGVKMLQSKGEHFDVAGNLRIDNWQNQNMVQFIIKDIMELK